MFFKKDKKTNKTEENHTKSEEGHSLSTLLEEFSKRSPDLVEKIISVSNKNLTITYIGHMVNDDKLGNFILKPLQKLQVDEVNFEFLEEYLPVGNTVITSDHKRLLIEIINGGICIRLEHEERCMLILFPKKIERPLEGSKNESMIFGPDTAFTESISTNLALIRKRFKDDNLTTEKMETGVRNKTEVRIVYLNDLADPENVQTLRQRINDLEIDDILDSTFLAQLLDDNSMSLFPQLLVTELPDRVCYMLSRGKIAVLVDQSPKAIIAPSSFLNFFETTDDVYTRWNIGSFLRLVRYTSLFLALLLTPMYVASLTHHYQVIPSAMLVSLGESRAKVPFPPLLEALILEFILELLREAGARLPTKVGQTMGIVGGIVIGQAAVEAGFTSNILVIIVAFSALGTFTAPSYMMGAVIRIVRFPLIILAGIWGGLGIAIGIIYLMLHLLELTSIGRPYLVPVYPFRFVDMKDSLLRLPLSLSSKRPVSNQPKDSYKYSKERAKRKNDIDE